VVAAALDDLPGALVILDDAFLKQACTSSARIDRSPSFAPMFCRAAISSFSPGPIQAANLYRLGWSFGLVARAPCETAINSCGPIASFPPAAPVEAMLVDRTGCR